MKQKIAYFGIDLLFDVLPFLYGQDVEIAVIFTAESTASDSTDRIQAFAREHQIPCKTAPATREDIDGLATMGVAFSITAGYPYRIPVSKVVRQVNVHPAYLPVGRGPWPMPVSILRNVPSGVTLHKIAEGFDCGDILLQREIPLAKDENLTTLMAKIQKTAIGLLDELLRDFDRIWGSAKPQGEGEYWQEPTEADRTITAQSTTEEASRKIRAFHGYGVLYQTAEGLLEIKEAVLLPPDAQVGFPLSDGKIIKKS